MADLHSTRTITDLGLCAMRTSNVTLTLYTELGELSEVSFVYCTNELVLCDNDICVTSIARATLHTKDGGARIV